MQSTRCTHTSFYSSNSQCYTILEIYSFNSLQNILNLLPFLLNKYSFHCIQVCFFLLQIHFLKNNLAYIALKHNFCDILHSSSLTYLPHWEAVRIIGLCFEVTSSHYCNSVFWHQKSLTFLTSTSLPHDLIITFLPFPALWALWLLQDPMRAPRPRFHSSTTTFAGSARVWQSSIAAFAARHWWMAGTHSWAQKAPALPSTWHTKFNMVNSLSHKTSAFSLPPKKGFTITYTKMIAFQISGRKGRVQRYTWAWSCSTLTFYHSSMALHQNTTKLSKIVISMSFSWFTRICWTP